MKVRVVLLFIFCNTLLHGLAMTEIPQVAPAEQKSTWYYDLIGKAVAPFKSGYGYSDEQKTAARKQIAELEAKKAEATTIYQAALSVAFGETHKELITHDYKEQIADLDKQIHEQKIITGEAMSFKRKLILAGIGVAGVTVGGALVYQWFVKQPNTKNTLPKKSELPIVKKPSEKKSVPVKQVEQQKIEQKQKTPKQQEIPKQQERIEEPPKSEIPEQLIDKQEKVAEQASHTEEQREKQIEEEAKKELEQQGVQGQNMQPIIEEEEKVEQKKQNELEQPSVQKFIEQNRNNEAGWQKAKADSVLELEYVERIRPTGEKEWGKSSGTIIKYPPFKLPPEIELSVDKKDPAGKKLIQSLEERLRLIEAQRKRPGYKNDHAVAAQQKIEQAKAWLEELRHW